MLERYAVLHFEKCPVFSPSLSLSFLGGGDDLRMIKFAESALWNATMAVSFRVCLARKNISRKEYRAETLILPLT